MVEFWIELINTQGDDLEPRARLADTRARSATTWRRWARCPATDHHHDRRSSRGRHTTTATQYR
jgi:hypothetical protein